MQSFFFDQTDFYRSCLLNIKGRTICQSSFPLYGAERFALGVFKDFYLI